MDPAKVGSPRLLKLNSELADDLRLDADSLESSKGVAFLSGQCLLEGSEPLAMAYCGHQFGHFNPQLGDGRAILLGELIDSEGARRDIHLKGSGRTPFSRGGDGLSALGPAIREYLVSEAMHALGVPTTRALAVLESGDQVYRDSIQPGGIFARVAYSHMRIGTFQWFASKGDRQNRRCWLTMRSIVCIHVV